MVPLLRRIPATVARLLRTWGGRAVLAAGLLGLPLGIDFLRTAADQRVLFGVSVGLVGFGGFFVLLCGWRRDDDPSSDPRKPGVWGYWDWRPDAGLIAGVCLVVVGFGGFVASLF